MRPTQQTSGTQGEGSKAARVTTKNGAVVPSEPLIDTSKLPPLESAAAFVKRDIPPLQHTVKGLVTEGVGLIAAREKVGKSWFCYQMAGCVASGEPFLGFQTERGSVLYFDFENSEPVRQERLRLMYPDGVPDRLFFISPPAEGDPWIIGEGFEIVLIHYLDQVSDARLVIIDVLDTVADDVKRGESEKKHAYRNIRKLRPIAQKYHIAIICVTHNRKLYDPDDFLSNISGSNGWAAAADYALGITKKRGEPDAVLQSDGRTCRGVELAITQDEKTMRWRQQGTLEQVLEYRRIKGFEQNDITKAVLQAVERSGGKWTGTADCLRGETLFNGGQDLTGTNKAVSMFISANADLFRKQCMLSVVNRNANNSKTDEWIITRMA